MAVDEVETVGVARVDLDAGVAGAADGEVVDIDEVELLAVGLPFADDEGNRSDEVFSGLNPATAGVVGEEALVLEDAREVEVHVLGEDDGAVGTEGVEELALVGDGIGLHAVDLLGAAAVVGQAAGEHVGREHAVAVIVGCSFFGLDELEVGALEVAEDDGAVVLDGLVPFLFLEVVLQVFGLEVPAVTGENLVAHEAQLFLGEARQPGGVEQVGGDDFGGGHLLEVALHEVAALQVGIEEVSQRPGGIALVIVEDQEMGNTVYEEFFHSGSFVDTQGDGTAAGEDGIFVLVLIPDKGDAVFVAVDVLADEIHGTTAEGAGLIEDGTVPELVAVLDGLGG